MTSSRISRFFTASLKGRVLVLTVAALLMLAVPSTLAFYWVVNATVVKLGTLFAEKQILFDRYRGLESLMREVSLAETVARSPAIVEWAGNETDPAKAERGLAELEHYRLSFKDKSYFVVLDGSKNYYFNDKDDSYRNDRKRYTLDAANPRDGWYFKTIALGAGCHLNVDHDDTLGVTKVWMNCIIRQGEQVLGIIGTGVDLSQFIREVVDIPQTGVQSMFVDRNGAVQAHRDPRLVDFHSLTKDVKAKKTIFMLLDDEADRTALSLMMAQVARGDALVQSRFMSIDGHETLVGVGYLDRLGWFNITLMDVDVIIDWWLFAPIALLLVTILLVAALLMTYLFKRNVLDRLALLESQVAGVRGGSFAPAWIDRSRDEIGRLSRAFGEMAQAVGDNTERLEAMVSERTEKLQQLAHRDPLTAALNRRGFEQAFAQEQNRAVRSGRCSGLALVDLDLFKPINDAHGHQAGDNAIIAIVARIQSVLRSYDVCARWGGDEFILLIAECDLSTLSSVAAKIAGVIAREPIRLEDGSEIAMTVSIGASIVSPEQSLESAAAQADAALYAAKQAGRAGFVIYDAARHGRSGKPALKLG
jgi:diguanylate cyclase (GGDEF)-like protein